MRQAEGVDQPERRSTVKTAFVLIALVLATATAQADHRVIICDAEIIRVAPQMMRLPDEPKPVKRVKKFVVRKPTVADEAAADVQQQGLARQEALADRNVAQETIRWAGKIVADAKALAEQEPNKAKRLAICDKANKQVATIMAKLQKRKPNLLVVNMATCVVER